MRVGSSGEYLDNPARKLKLDLISYEGVTTAAGSALGITLVDAGLAGEPSYQGLAVKILSGPAWGQVRPIFSHPAGSNTLTIDPANPFTNPAGAAQQITAGVAFCVISQGGASLTDILAALSRPNRSLIETWQDELGIDFTVWTVTNPATGAAWARGAVGELLMAAAAPNALENARLRSVQRWLATATLAGTNKILRRLLFEFEFHVVGLANLDNAAFFLGLTSGIADTRATNNIIGFGLVGAGNALQTVTDAGGAETVNTGFGENLLLTNKLRIEVFTNHVLFYLNEALIADHTTNAPDLPMYLQFYIPTGAGGAATPRIGTVRAWYEDFVRV